MAGTIYVGSGTECQYRITNPNAVSQGIINQAINYASANGYDTVYLKGPLTYWINDSIIMKSNLKLIGDRSAVVKLVANAQWAAWKPLIGPTGTTVSNIEYAGFTIDGNHDANYDPNYAPASQPSTKRPKGKGFFNFIHHDNATNIKVHDMFLHDGHGDGLRITKGNNIQYYNNTVQYLGHDAVFFLRSNNCHSYNNKIITRTNSGGRANDCTNSSFHHNDISSYDKWDAGGPGIQIERQYNATISVEVYNNYFHATYGPGMWIIRNSAAVAESGSSSVKVHHNVFYDCGHNPNIHYVGGIVVYEMQGVKVENNVFNKCRGHGLVCMGGSDTATAASSISGIVVKSENNIIINTVKRASSGTKTGVGVQNRLPTSHRIAEQYNCVWNNVGGNYSSVTPGTGEINKNPLLVDVDSGNYKLSSTSPCIRAGNPATPVTYETRISMGNYGNTETMQVVTPTPTPDPEPEPEPDIRKWEWDFGDGSKSIERNPTHTFQNPGTYTVTLTITNNAGTDIQKKTITVTEVGPTADFEMNKDTGVVPLSITFTNLSQNAASYKWEFGDGATSTATNPVHSYSLAGNYTVTLTAKDSNGKTNTTSQIVNAKNSGSMPDQGKASYDNVICSASASTVNTDTNLMVGTTTATGTYRSLLRFDLRQYADKTIYKAVLKLCWHSPNKSRTIDTTLEVYRPTLWNPNKVTWNNYDEKGKWSKAGGDWHDVNGALQGSVPYATLTFAADAVADEQYHEIDVTDLVKLYASDDDKNTGFLIKAKDESDDSLLTFYNSEVNINTQVPILELTTEPEERIMQPPIIYVAGDGTGDYNCDGEDDHVQINTALKYVAEHSDQYTTVYLKGPFTYKIAASLLVGNTTTLTGDSTAVVELVDNANWNQNIPLLKQLYASVSDVTINGFTIDGNRSNNTDSSRVSGNYYYTLMWFNSAKNVEIFNMELKNGHYDGIYINNSSLVNIHDNSMSSLGHADVCVMNSKDVDIINNILTVRVDSGIRIFNSDNILIDDNDITSDNTGNAAIIVQKSGTSAMANVTVKNNKIYDMYRGGIWVIGSESYKSETAQINIHHNLITSCGTRTGRDCAGIVINGFNAIIENNTIDSCKDAGIAIRQILDVAANPTGTPNILIQNNIVTNNLYGIYNEYPNYVVDVKYNDVWNFDKLVISDCDAIDNWAVGYGSSTSFAIDTADKTLGIGSLVFSGIPAASGNGSLIAKYVANIDLTGMKFITFDIKPDLAGNVYFQLVSSSGEWRYYVINNVQANVWRRISLPLDCAQGTNNCVTVTANYNPATIGQIYIGINNSGNTTTQASIRIDNLYADTVSLQDREYYGVTPQNCINVDPLFADASSGNYRLKSKAGRWSGDHWELDEEKSPCIDAGNPASPSNKEIEPNGDVINLGYDGNTEYASQSGDLPGSINVPPILDDIPNYTGKIGHQLYFTIHGYDPDVNDTLTYSASPMPNGASLDETTGEFVWTPAINQAGVYEITFTVSDQRLTDSKTVIIGILEQQTISLLAGKVVTARLREASPNTVINSTPFIDVGEKYNVGKSRTLMSFDLSEVGERTISVATLRLFFCAPEGQERDYDTVIDVYRPEEWNPDYVTWYTRNDSEQWVNAGGNWYDSEGTPNGEVPYGSVTISADTLPTFDYIDIDVTQLVQDYIDGNVVNTGFFIKARTENDNYVMFYSNNFDIVGKRSVLNIVYVD